MRSRRISCTSDVADNLACGYKVPSITSDAGKMGIARIAVIVRMVDEHLVSIPVFKVSDLDNLSIENTGNSSTILIAEIDARVKFVFPCNRMDAPTERRCDGKIFCK